MYFSQSFFAAARPKVVRACLTKGTSQKGILILIEIIFYFSYIIENIEYKEVH